VYTIRHPILSGIVHARLDAGMASGMIRLAPVSSILRMAGLTRPECRRALCSPGRHLYVTKMSLTAMFSPRR
jgi:hypothetical protein